MTTTVAAYFHERLGSILESCPALVPSFSPHHPSFTIETACGADCRAVIDLGADLLALCADIGVEERAAVINAIRSQVRVFVYG